MRSIEGKLNPEILEFIGGDPRTVASSNAFPIKTFRELLNRVKLWVSQNDKEAKEEFRESASEIIDVLKTIQKELNKST